MKTLTEVLAEHVLLDSLACKCRWFPAEAVTVLDARRDWAAHVAAAYREARTITSEQELVALPRYTLISYRGVPMRREDAHWHALSTRICHYDAEVLPALVLWTPGDAP